MPKSKESPYFCQTFAQHRSIVCTRVLKVLLMKHSFSSVFRSIVSTRLPRNFLGAPLFQGAHIFVTRPQEWQFQSRIKLGDRVALAETQQGAKRKHSLHVFLYCFFFPLSGLVHFLQGKEFISLLSCNSHSRVLGNLFCKCSCSF